MTRIARDRANLRGDPLDFAQARGVNGFGRGIDRRELADQETVMRLPVQIVLACKGRARGRQEHAFEEIGISAQSRDDALLDQPPALRRHAREAFRMRIVGPGNAGKRPVERALLTERDPLFRRLCKVGFDGAGFEILLETDEDVAVEADIMAGRDQHRPFGSPYASRGVSPTGRHAVIRLKSPIRPTVTILLDLASGARLELGTSNVAALWTAPLPRPFEVLAADRATTLYGAMHVPSDFDEKRRYPLVDYIYPGPQTAWHGRSFPSAPGLTAQALRNWA